MCDQQRLRPACAYAQTDQSLCWSLEYSMSVKLLTEHHLEFLSLTGACTGSSESPLVKMPHRWKSRVTAHINKTLSRTIISHNIPDVTMLLGGGGAQWLSGRVLDSRPKGPGFEPHRRHCVVVLEQDTFILA